MWIKYTVNKMTGRPWKSEGCLRSPESGAMDDCEPSFKCEKLNLGSLQEHTDEPSAQPCSLIFFKNTALLNINLNLAYFSPKPFPTMHPDVRWKKVLVHWEYFPSQCVLFLSSTEGCWAGQWNHTQDVELIKELDHENISFRARIAEPCV